MTESDRFVLVEGKQFVALDSASGGYPHMVSDLWRAELWKEKTQALRYRVTMHKETEWVLQRVRYELVDEYISQGDLAEARQDPEYKEFIRLAQKFGVAEKKCVRDVSWAGRCRKDAILGEDFCEQHLKDKCFKCGAQAVKDCGHAGQFVCGMPECAKHTHTH